VKTRSLITKSSVVLILISLSFQPVAANSATDSNAIPGKSATWLETLNYYRTASGVPPVTESKAFSAAAKAHAIYVGKTPEKYFTGIYANKHK
jgi:uncharacterized protein YkwD